MRKAYSSAVIVVLALVIVAGCTKGYETRKSAGDHTVILSAGSYPLVKGDNNLTVKLTDSTGKAVTDAKVNVRYYMPPMPGMAPMDYNTQAVLKGDRYAFSANIPMEGGWKTEVSVARPGKPAASALFNVDAR